MLDKLNWLNVEQKIIFNTMTLIFKNYLNKYVKYNYESHQYLTTKVFYFKFVE